MAVAGAGVNRLERFNDAASLLTRMGDRVSRHRRFRPGFNDAASLLTRMDASDASMFYVGKELQ